MAKGNTLKKYTIEIDAKIDNAESKINALKGEVEALYKDKDGADNLLGQFSNIQKMLTELKDSVNGSVRTINQSFENLSSDSVIESFSKLETNVDKSLTAIAEHVRSLGVDSLVTPFAELTNAIKDFQVEFKRLNDSRQNGFESGKALINTDEDIKKQIAAFKKDAKALFDARDLLQRGNKAAGIKGTELNFNLLSRFNIDDVDERNYSKISDIIGIISKMVEEANNIPSINANQILTNAGINATVEDLEKAIPALKRKMAEGTNRANRPAQYGNKEFKDVRQTISLVYDIATPEDGKTQQEIDAIVDTLKNGVIKKVENLIKKTPIRIPIGYTTTADYKDWDEIIDPKSEDTSILNDSQKILVRNLNLQIKANTQGLLDDINNEIDSINKQITKTIDVKINPYSERGKQLDDSLQKQLENNPGQLEFTGNIRTDLLAKETTLRDIHGLLSGLVENGFKMNGDGQDNKASINEKFKQLREDAEKSYGYLGYKTKNSKINPILEGNEKTVQMLNNSLEYLSELKNIYGSFAGHTSIEKLKENELYTGYIEHDGKKYSKYGSQTINGMTYAITLEDWQKMLEFSVEQKLFKATKKDVRERVQNLNNPYVSDLSQYKDGVQGIKDINLANKINKQFQKISETDYADLSNGVLKEDLQLVFDNIISLVETRLSSATDITDAEKQVEEIEIKTLSNIKEAISSLRNNLITTDKYFNLNNAKGVVEKQITSTTDSLATLGHSKKWNPTTKKYETIGIGKTYETEKNLMGQFKDSVQYVMNTYGSDYSSTILSLEKKIQSIDKEIKVEERALAPIAKADQQLDSLKDELESKNMSYVLKIGERELKDKNRALNLYNKKNQSQDDIDELFSLLNKYKKENESVDNFKERIRKEVDYQKLYDKYTKQALVARENQDVHINKRDLLSAQKDELIQQKKDIEALQGQDQRTFAQQLQDARTEVLELTAKRELMQDLITLSEKENQTDEDRLRIQEGLNDLSKSEVSYKGKNLAEKIASQKKVEELRTEYSGLQNKSLDAKEFERFRQIPSEIESYFVHEIQVDLDWIKDQLTSPLGIDSKINDAQKEVDRIKRNAKSVVAQFVSNQMNATLNKYDLRTLDASSDKLDNIISKDKYKEVTEKLKKDREEFALLSQRISENKLGNSSLDRKNNQRVSQNNSTGLSYIERDRYYALQQEMISLQKIVDAYEKVNSVGAVDLSKNIDQKKLLISLYETRQKYKDESIEDTRSESAKKQSDEKYNELVQLLKKNKYESEDKLILRLQEEISKYNESISKAENNATISTLRVSKDIKQPYENDWVQFNQIRDVDKNGSQIYRSELKTDNEILNDAANTTNQSIDEAIEKLEQMKSNAQAVYDELMNMENQSIAKIQDDAIVSLEKSAEILRNQSNEIKKNNAARKQKIQKKKEDGTYTDKDQKAEKRIAERDLEAKELSDLALYYESGIEKFRKLKVGMQSIADALNGADDKDFKTEKKKANFNVNDDNFISLETLNRVDSIINEKVDSINKNSNELLNRFSFKDDNGKLLTGDDLYSAKYIKGIIKDLESGAKINGLDAWNKLDTEVKNRIKVIIDENIKNLSFIDSVDPIVNKETGESRIEGLKKLFVSNISKPYEDEYLELLGEYKNFQDLKNDINKLMVDLDHANASHDEKSANEIYERVEALRKRREQIHAISSDLLSPEFLRQYSGSTSVNETTNTTLFERAMQAYELNSAGANFSKISAGSKSLEKDIKKLNLSINTKDSDGNSVFSTFAGTFDALTQINKLLDEQKRKVLILENQKERAGSKKEVASYEKQIKAANSYIEKLEQISAKLKEQRELTRLVGGNLNASKETVSKRIEATQSQIDLLKQTKANLQNNAEIESKWIQGEDGKLTNSYYEEKITDQQKIIDNYKDTLKSRLQVIDNQIKEKTEALEKLEPEVDLAKDSVDEARKEYASYISTIKNINEETIRQLYAQDEELIELEKQRASIDVEADKEEYERIKQSVLLKHGIVKQIRETNEILAKHGLDAIVGNDSRSIIDQIKYTGPDEEKRKASLFNKINVDKALSGVGEEIVIKLKSDLHKLVRDLNLVEGENLNDIEIGLFSAKHKANQSLIARTVIDSKIQKRKQELLQYQQKTTKKANDTSYADAIDEANEELKNKQKQISQINEEIERLMAERDKEFSSIDKHIKNAELVRDALSSKYSIEATKKINSSKSKEDFINEKIQSDLDEISEIESKYGNEKEIETKEKELRSQIDEVHKTTSQYLFETYDSIINNFNSIIELEREKQSTLDSYKQGEKIKNIKIVNGEKQFEIESFEETDEEFEKRKNDYISSVNKRIVAIRENIVKSSRAIYQNQLDDFYQINGRDATQWDDETKVDFDFLQIPTVIAAGLKNKYAEITYRLNSYIKKTNGEKSDETNKYIESYKKIQDSLSSNFNILLDIFRIDVFDSDIDSGIENYTPEGIDDFGKKEKKNFNDALSKYDAITKFKSITTFGYDEYLDFLEISKEDAKKNSYSLENLKQLFQQKEVEIQKNLVDAATEYLNYFQFNVDSNGLLSPIVFSRNSDTPNEKTKTNSNIRNIIENDAKLQELELTDENNILETNKSRLATLRQNVYIQKKNLDLLKYDQEIDHEHQAMREAQTEDLKEEHRANEEHLKASRQAYVNNVMSDPNNKVYYDENRKEFTLNRASNKMLNETMERLASKNSQVGEELLAATEAVLAARNKSAEILDSNSLYINQAKEIAQSSKDIMSVQRVAGMNQEQADFYYIYTQRINELSKVFEENGKLTKAQSDELKQLERKASDLGLEFYNKDARFKKIKSLVTEKDYLANPLKYNTNSYIEGAIYGPEDGGKNIIDIGQIHSTSGLATEATLQKLLSVNGKYGGDNIINQNGITVGGKNGKKKSSEFKTFEDLGKYEDYYSRNDYRKAANNILRTSTSESDIKNVLNQAVENGFKVYNDIDRETGKENGRYILGKNKGQKGYYGKPGKDGKQKSKELKEAKNITINGDDIIAPKKEVKTGEEKPKENKKSTGGVPKEITNFANELKEKYGASIFGGKGQDKKDSLKEFFSKYEEASSFYRFVGDEKDYKLVSIKGNQYQKLSDEDKKKSDELTKQIINNLTGKTIELKNEIDELGDSSSEASGSVEKLSEATKEQKEDSKTDDSPITYDPKKTYNVKMMSSSGVVELTASGEEIKAWEGNIIEAVEVVDEAAEETLEHSLSIKEQIDEIWTKKGTKESKDAEYKKLFEENPDAFNEYALVWDGLSNHYKALSKKGDTYKKNKDEYDAQTEEIKNVWKDPSLLERIIAKRKGIAESLLDSLTLESIPAPTKEFDEVFRKNLNYLLSHANLTTEQKEDALRVGAKNGFVVRRRNENNAFANGNREFFAYQDDGGITQEDIDLTNKYRDANDQLTQTLVEQARAKKENKAKDKPENENNVLDKQTIKELNRLNKKDSYKKEGSRTKAFKKLFESNPELFNLYAFGKNKDGRLIAYSKQGDTYKKNKDEYDATTTQLQKDWGIFSSAEQKKEEIKTTEDLTATQDKLNQSKANEPKPTSDVQERKEEKDVAEDLAEAQEKLNESKSDEPKTTENSKAVEEQQREINDLAEAQSNLNKNEEKVAESAKNVGISVSKIDYSSLSSELQELMKQYVLLQQLIDADSNDKIFFEAAAGQVNIENQLRNFGYRTKKNIKEKEGFYSLDSTNSFLPIEYFTDSIMSNKGELISVVSQFAQIPEDVIRSVLQINSPSEVMKELGYWTGKGFEIGIEESFDIIAAKILSKLNETKIPINDFKTWAEKELAKNPNINKNLKEGIESLTSNDSELGKSLQAWYKYKDVLGEIVNIEKTAVGYKIIGKNGNTITRGKGGVYSISKQLVSDDLIEAKAQQKEIKKQLKDYDEARQETANLDYLNKNAKLELTNKSYDGDLKDAQNAEEQFVAKLSETLDNLKNIVGKDSDVFKELSNKFEEIKKKSYSPSGKTTDVVEGWKNAKANKDINKADRNKKKEKSEAQKARTKSENRIQGLLDQYETRNALGSSEDDLNSYLLELKAAVDLYQELLNSQVQSGVLTENEAKTLRENLDNLQGQVNLEAIRRKLRKEEASKPKETEEEKIALEENLLWNRKRSKENKEENKNQSREEKEDDSARAKGEKEAEEYYKRERNNELKEAEYWDEKRRKREKQEEEDRLKLQVASEAERLADQKAFEEEWEQNEAEASNVQREIAEYDELLATEDKKREASAKEEILKAQQTVAKTQDELAELSYEQENGFENSDAVIHKNTLLKEQLEILSNLLNKYKEAGLLDEDNVNSLYSSASERKGVISDTKKEEIDNRFQLQANEELGKQLAKAEEEERRKARESYKALMKEQTDYVNEFEQEDHASVQAQKYAELNRLLLEYSTIMSRINSNKAFPEDAENAEKLDAQILKLDTDIRNSRYFDPKKSQRADDKYANIINKTADADRARELAEEAVINKEAEKRAKTEEENQKKASDLLIKLAAQREELEKAKIALNDANALSQDKESDIKNIAKAEEKYEQLKKTILETVEAIKELGSREQGRTAQSVVEWAIQSTDRNKNISGVAEKILNLREKNKKDEIKQKARAKSEIEEVQARIEENKSKLDTVSSEVSSLEAEIQNQQSQLDNAISEKERLEQSIAEKKAKILQGESIAAEANKKISETKEKAEADRKFAEAIIAERDQKQKEYEEAKQALNSSIKAMEEANVELSRLEAERERISIQLNSTKEKILGLGGKDGSANPYEDQLLKAYEKTAEIESRPILDESSTTLPFLEQAVAQAKAKLESATNEEVQLIEVPAEVELVPIDEVDSSNLSVLEQAVNDAKAKLASVSGEAIPFIEVPAKVELKPIDEVDASNISVLEQAVTNAKAKLENVSNEEVPTIAVPAEVIVRPMREIDESRIPELNSAIGELLKEQSDNEIKKISLDNTVDRYKKQQNDLMENAKIREKIGNLRIDELEQRANDSNKEYEESNELAKALFEDKKVKEQNLDAAQASLDAENERIEAAKKVNEQRRNDLEVAKQEEKNIKNDYQSYEDADELEKEQLITAEKEKQVQLEQQMAVIENEISNAKTNADNATKNVYAGQMALDEAKDSLNGIEDKVKTIPSSVSDTSEKEELVNTTKEEVDLLKQQVAEEEKTLDLENQRIQTAQSNIDAQNKIIEAKKAESQELQNQINKDQDFVNDNTKKKKPKKEIAQENIANAINKKKNDEIEIEKIEEILNQLEIVFNALNRLDELSELIESKKLLGENVDDLLNEESEIKENLLKDYKSLPFESKEQRQASRNEILAAHIKKEEEKKTLEDDLLLQENEIYKNRKIVSPEVMKAYDFADKQAKKLEEKLGDYASKSITEEVRAEIVEFISQLRKKSLEAFNDITETNAKDKISDIKKLTDSKEGLLTKGYSVTTKSATKDIETWQKQYRDYTTSSKYTKAFAEEAENKLKGIFGENANADSFNNLNVSELLNSEKAEQFKNVLYDIKKVFDELGEESGLDKNLSANSITVSKLRAKIADVLKDNTKMSSQLREQFEALQRGLQNDPDPTRKATREEMELFQDRVAYMKESGQEGLSYFDQIKSRLHEINKSFISMYLSVNDLIRYAREAFQIVKEFDTALTEMRKVSNEPLIALQQYQKRSFELAENVGTTALDLQNSTAEFMRLGQGLDEASQSAMNATKLMNVSEFTNVTDATDSLIAMKAAYDDLSQDEIIDKLNNIGNNFSISTNDLATALQKSASVLMTQGKTSCLCA